MLETATENPLDNSSESPDDPLSGEQGGRGGESNTSVYYICREREIICSCIPKGSDNPLTSIMHGIFDNQLDTIAR